MELTIEQALQQGVAAHKEGKLQDAERLYRAILQSQSLHPDANHNLGVIAVSVDKADVALPLFKIALEANPKIEQFWLSYIAALIKAKQLETAKTVLEQGKKDGLSGGKVDALESQLKHITQSALPKSPERKKSLTLKEKRKKIAASKQQNKQAKGKNTNSLSPSKSKIDTLLAHYQNGRYDEAEKLAVTITQEFPTHQFGWKALGAVLKQTGRRIESLTAMQKSVQLAPQDAEARSNLGIILKELGRLDEAEVNLRQAIALKPDLAEAHSNLGITLQELGRLGEAEASYTQAIALKPDYAEAHYNLGDVYKKIGKHSRAVECFEKVLELSSEDFLGATLQLASLGKRKIPDKTPEKYMQEFYRKKSKRWSDLDIKQDKYRGHLLIENAFKITHNPSKQVEILDLGCGTGSLARTLRPYARTLVGVDLSPDMLFKAKEIGLYDSLYKKDLNQYLGEILNHYDTVVAAAVLIHFFNLDNIFFLVRESLKVNGRFIFSIFEETKKNRDLNSFLMYSHSDDYVTELADRLNLKIIYRQKDTHEYHRGIPVTAIIYVLEKLS